MAASETTITATELARNLSDILNRVKYRGERFLVERNGEAVATLEPAKALPPKGTLRDLIRLTIEAGLDEDWADDMEKVHADMNQPVPPGPDWPD